MHKQEQKPLLNEMEAYRKLMGSRAMRSLHVEFMHPLWWCNFGSQATVNATWTVRHPVAEFPCPFVHGWVALPDARQQCGRLSYAGASSGSNLVLVHGDKTTHRRKRGFVLHD